MNMTILMEVMMQPVEWSTPDLPVCSTKPLAHYRANSKPAQ